MPTTTRVTRHEMTRAEWAKCQRSARAFLASVGAERQPENARHEFRIPTKHGMIGVSFCRYGTGVIFCGFDEPERAARGVQWVNPHSGKWNHHYGRMPGQAAAQDFERQLRAILTCKQEEQEA